MLLWRLILALLISDFVLQLNWIIRHKNQAKGLLLHGLIHLLVSVCLTVDLLNSNLILLIGALTVVHTSTDIIKDHLSRCVKSLNWLWFLLDQSVHLITIVIGVSLISSFDLAYVANLMNTVQSTALLKYFSLFVITLMAGKYFTNYVTQNYQPEESEGSGNSHAVIGIFERFLITISVLIGRFEIIGFLIAAKSIIRLPEARTLDRQSDEKSRRMVNYYLIGTFTSYSWAIAFSVIFIKLIR